MHELPSKHFLSFNYSVMQSNQLQRVRRNKKSIRVGRGGKRGKTSGRGHKGQKAHGGHGIRPAIRDMIKKIPKLRGRGKNIFRSIKAKPAVVNLHTIESLFNSGEEVSPKTLVAKGIVRRNKGKLPSVKILSFGVLKKKVMISRCTVSETAREHIEKVGGSIA